MRLVTGRNRVNAPLTSFHPALHRARDSPRAPYRRYIRPDRTQQARNLVARWESVPFRFLIRDRNAKYSRTFDEVLRSEGATVIRTPIRAPRAHAFAERFVGTLRRECLDRTLIFGRRQLESVVRAYVAHFNGHRPHRHSHERADPDEPFFCQPVRRQHR